MAMAWTRSNIWTSRDSLCNSNIPRIALGANKVMHDVVENLPTIFLGKLVSSNTYLTQTSLASTRYTPWMWASLVLHPVKMIPSAGSFWSYRTRNKLQVNKRRKKKKIVFIQFLVLQLLLSTVQPMSRNKLTQSPNRKMSHCKLFWGRDERELKKQQTVAGRQLQQYVI